MQILFPYALLSLMLSASVALAEPVKIIFDTDMGNDVDDALALAMLHSLQTRNEVELLAVTLTKDHAEVAPYVDAINTFYGRGEIPIAKTDSGITPGQSRFTGVGLERDGGEYVYPHDLNIGDQVPLAVALLRETLANQEDKSVVIVQVGFSTNLAQLLQTEADDYSELNGFDLVERKVKNISIMAGAFEPINGETHLEYNVVQDIPSAQYLAEYWPTPIYWSGFEIGLAIHYPAISIEEDFGYLERHPISESYQAYIPTPHERPTWDLTSVLWTAREDRNYFGVSEPGIVTVLEDGETIFESNLAGSHFYLTIPESEIGAVQELLAALVSEPPN